MLIYNDSSGWIGSEIGKRHRKKYATLWYYYYYFMVLLILTFEINWKKKYLKKSEDAPPCSFPQGARAIWGPVEWTLL